MGKNPCCFDVFSCASQYSELIFGFTRNPDALESVSRKGTIVSIGNASGPVPPISLLTLSSKNIKVARPTLGNYVATGKEWSTYTTELFDLIAKGVIKQTVYKEYPFSAEGVRQTQNDITSRKTLGKLLLHIS